MERGLGVRARWCGRVSTIAVAAVWLVLSPATSPAEAIVAQSGVASAAPAGAADQAEQLRAGLTDDPVAFIKASAPLEQVTLVNALGGFDARSTTHISWFFRTASSTLSGDASMPIVTFYNPLADAALVTTWRRIDAHWWLTSVVRLDGQTLRGARGASWWSDRRPVAQSLQRQGFMYRGASYSRMVVAISAATLFVLATIARIDFRVVMEMLRRHGKNEVKILMVGTDRVRSAPNPGWRVGQSFLSGLSFQEGPPRCVLNRRGHFLWTSMLLVVLVEAAQGDCSPGWNHPDYSGLWAFVEPIDPGSPPGLYGGLCIGPLFCCLGGLLGG